jgi:hypothetical protein
MCSLTVKRKVVTCPGFRIWMIGFTDSFFEQYLLITSNAELSLIYAIYKPEGRGIESR